MLSTLSPRFELFKDGHPQLQRVLQFLQSEVVPTLGCNALRVNVPNKRPGQSQHLLSLGTTISNLAPGSETCLHYSLKYQGGATPLFHSFCQNAGAIAGCSVLLVSGSGKSKLDSCQCLEQLKLKCSKDSLPPIGVAFSPYENSSVEQARLKRKLNSGLVSEVWLQLGSDLEKLRQGITFLKQSGVKTLYGSVFVPTKQLLAKQRARPWSGVYLSDDYLGSVTAAEAITVQILKLYNEFGVTPLIESPVESTDALTTLAVLLQRSGHSLCRHPASAPNSEHAQECFTRRWGHSPHLASGGSTERTSPSLLEEKMLNGPGSNSGFESHLPSGVLRDSFTDAGHMQRRSAGIVWMRQDLRTHDNPALLEAAKKHAVVVPLFIWCPEEEKDATPGRAAQIWLRASLRSLAAELERLGSQLILRRSKSYARCLVDVAREVGASMVYFCRRYEPSCMELDKCTVAALASHGIGFEDFPAYLLYEPTKVSMGHGYTSGHWGTLMPFYKACLASGKPRRPRPAPQRLEQPSEVDSVPLEHLGLESGISEGGENWGASICMSWPEISEHAALKAMTDFVNGGLRSYEKNRSRADLDTNPNSKLSAFLRWGQISSSDLYWAVQDARLSYEETKTFGRRLFWRDLAYFQMQHFPEMRRKAIRSHYDFASWRQDRQLLRCWQSGATGYPLVDASMRELRKTGWAQQNLRMVAASFLTEFLNISWVEGAKWYEDQLVDADLAINSMMWQNAGRSGIDQWNFLISPVEAKAQDPSGAYVRRWIPELAKLPLKYLHKPWEAPADVLLKSEVQLGTTYPHRCITDLKSAREDAKQATLEMRRGIANTWMNDHQGYDVIALPGGHTTKVFTKKEYRLPKKGEESVTSATVSNKGSGKTGSKRNNEFASGQIAKAPRTLSKYHQLSIQDFSGSKRVEAPCWGKLVVPAFEAHVIDIDDSE